ncbi:MAG: hypothetical protein IID13_11325 [Candidatus Marinimicrobia bacterium]|nr:hypothetical protein [Candidatus Neomarinimicrobiota bacterium]
MNILKNLANMIRGDAKRLTDGRFQLTFQNGSESGFCYNLHIDDRKVVEESIEIDGKVMLTREGEVGNIRDLTSGDLKEIEPPPDKLTLHVRRDKKEHPYFEDLYSWADTYSGFAFSSH